MMPIAVPQICMGNEIFISFCTPDKEVKVDAPVKFIAINDEIPPMSKNHDIISKIFVPKKLKYSSNIAMSQPITSPLSENLLKGIMGNRIGVKTQPDK
jgi:hypothetical protein